MTPDGASTREPRHWVGDGWVARESASPLFLLGHPASGGIPKEAPRVPVGVGRTVGAVPSGSAKLP